MKTLYSLLLLLLLLSACGDNNAPIPPKHQGYIFQHETIAPEVEGEGCHEGYIEVALGAFDDYRDSRLAKYNVDKAELAETSTSVAERVQMMFNHVPGAEQEQLSGILNKMRPYLPEELQSINVYFVRHRIIGDGYINAFTFVGDNIYFSTGLWNVTENLDEVAMILGHEIGHHTNFHVVEIFRAKQRWLERLDYLGIATQNRAKIAAVLEEFISKGCGQQDEIEADLCGMYLCKMAGYDPSVGANLFDTFSTFHNPHRSLWQRLRSSHPAPENRKACINSYLMVAQDSADALYARELAVYQEEYNSWTIKQSLVHTATESGIPFGTAALGLLLLILGRRRRVNPTVRFIGVMLICGSLGYIAVENIKFSTHSQSVQPIASFGSPCEYEEDGCNEVYSYAEVTTNSTVLNLRSSPSLEGEEIGELRKGIRVFCEYCSRKDKIGQAGGRWCHIVTDSGLKGWAWGGFLTII